MDLLTWVMGLTGLSFLGLALLAVFAPSVLAVLSEWLKALAPIIRGIADLLVAFWKICWEGIKDIADNLSTVIFYLVSVALAFLIGVSHGKKERVVVTKCDGAVFQCDPKVEYKTKYRTQYKYLKPSKPEASSNPIERFNPFN